MFAFLISSQVWDGNKKKKDFQIILLFNMKQSGYKQVGISNYTSSQQLYYEYN